MKKFFKWLFKNPKCDCEKDCGARSGPYYFQICRSRMPKGPPPRPAKGPSGVPSKYNEDTDLQLLRTADLLAGYAAHNRMHRPMVREKIFVVLKSIRDSGRSS